MFIPFFNAYVIVTIADIQFGKYECPTVTDTYIFFCFCVGVFIIRYDKMVSHMMPTCAFVFVIKACDPGKDLP
jgi:hypothetical protein